jgi:CRISPR-associated protein Cmx8
MFRAAHVLALLRGQHWYTEFGALLTERPWPFFVQSERTPRNLPSFAEDATGRFRALLENEQTRRQHAMETGLPPQPASLETLVYRLVRTYVWTKTEQRSGITYASFKDRKVKDKQGRERVDYPRDYTDAQEKVCSDLFLGLRARRDDDFVSYFTATVGSVAQGKNLSDETDFHIIAQALLNEDRRRDVQTLAMLAAAAASYATTGTEDNEDDTDTGDRPE